MLGEFHIGALCCQCSKKPGPYLVPSLVDKRIYDEIDVNTRSEGLINGVG